VVFTSVGGGCATCNNNTNATVINRYIKTLYFQLTAVTKNPSQHLITIRAVHLSDEIHYEISL